VERQDGGSRTDFKNVRESCSRRVIIDDVRYVFAICLREINKCLPSVQSLEKIHNLRRISLGLGNRYNIWRLATNVPDDGKSKSGCVRTD